MFISVILKNWRLILDAAIVVVLIVLLFIWNPLGIFGKGLKLESTANLVSEVKGIGELVTAEYYGEVISSLDEYLDVEVYNDALTARADIGFSDLKYALYELYKVDSLSRKERKQLFDNRLMYSDVKKKNIRRKLLYLNPTVSSDVNLTTSDLYQAGVITDSLLLSIAEYLGREKYDMKRTLRKDLKDKQVAEVLFSLYKELVVQRKSKDALAFERYLQNGFELDVAFNEFIKAKERTTTKSYKKELAMIGRGWVKAGFDLGSIEEHKLVYNKEKQEIHLFGIYPKILDYDINPWFIPEKQVPGYQIIHFNKHVNFEDAKKVKQYCRDRLRESAERANILESAQQSGESALKSFFGLLIGEEIKAVHFHSDPLEGVLEAMKMDNRISYEEAKTLDSMIVLQIRAENNKTPENQAVVKSHGLRLHNFIKELQSVPYGMKQHKFTPFSGLYSYIVDDGVLDKQDLDSLFRVRNELLKMDSSLLVENTKWRFIYGEDKQIYEDFNTLLKQLRTAVPSNQSIVNQSKQESKLLADSTQSTAAPDSISLVSTMESKEIYVFTASDYANLSIFGLSFSASALDSAVFGALASEKLETQRLKKIVPEYSLAIASSSILLRWPDLSDQTDLELSVKDKREELVLLSAYLQNKQNDPDSDWISTSRDYLKQTALGQWMQ